MEHFSALNLYQKAVILCMAVMTVFFLILYAITVPRVGFDYNNTILVPSRENGNTIYSGRVQGQPVSFTVSADSTVVYRHGGKTFGPYTAREDPAAVPKNADMSDVMVGVVLSRGDSALFRGGVLRSRNGFLLYNEDGTLRNKYGIAVVTADGTWLDKNGDVIDPHEPSAVSILQVMSGPVLTHKGAWFMWVIAAITCALNTLSIFLAEDLFHLKTMLRSRNAGYVQPSVPVIAGRYIRWTALFAAALVIFLLGLQ